MKKLLLVLGILLPLMASANTVNIDGIYYNLITKVKTAEVIQNPKKYLGDISIPSNLTYNDIEYSVTSIGEMAFSGCDRLTSVIIPNSVTNIGDYAFEGCINVGSFTIPNSVTSIGCGAFSSCLSLGAISIPNSVLSMGQNAFSGCTNLRTAIIGDGLTTLDGTFCECTKLSTVTFGKNITTITEYAFSRCNGLSDVVIPNSVSYIGYGAFYECSGLKTIILPNSVTNIGESAFEGCDNLLSVNIPNKVTCIGGHAFFGCSALKSIEIPNGVTTIGSHAFYNCSVLNSLSIPNSVTTIESFAFMGCKSLTKIVIGKGLINIYGGSFANCHELADVTCLSENVPILKYLNNVERIGVFQGSYIEYATLHVPESSIQSYQTTLPWSGFGRIVKIEGEEPEVKKCYTPTINYVNGQLIFESETDGVQFISEIADTDIKKHYDAEISLSATYNISVYATKEGYENSEVATATLFWVKGIMDDEDAVAEVKAMPVLIQANDGELNISGAPEGAAVSIYDISGRLLGTSTATNGKAKILMPQTDKIVIVKIGDNSIKVSLK